MHAVLYGNQHALEDGDLTSYALQLQLDIYAFNQVRSDRRTSSLVQEHLQSGRESGVTVTPAIFINGVRYAHPVDYNDLFWAVMQERAMTVAQGSRFR